MPEGATTGPVVVTVGTQSSAGVTFTVTSAPSGPIISKLEPDSGPVGTEIKIKGSNFGDAGTVTFNGVTASQINWTDKKIRVNVPSTATDGPVVVTTAAGQQSNGVTFDVTDGVPIISKLEPDSGPVLTQVKIKGSNFGDQEGTVTFNGVTASASRWNHQIIRTQVPQGATTGPVVVTAGGQSSAGVTFTVTEPEPEPAVEPENQSPEPEPDQSLSRSQSRSLNQNQSRNQSRNQNRTRTRSLQSRNLNQSLNQSQNPNQSQSQSQRTRTRTRTRARARTRTRAGARARRSLSRESGGLFPRT